MRDSYNKRNLELIRRSIFDLAERGPSLFLARMPVPLLLALPMMTISLSKAELMSIQKGLEDIKNGRTYRMQEGESLTDFLKRTEACEIEFSEEATKGLIKMMKSDVQVYKEV